MPGDSPDQTRDPAVAPAVGTWFGLAALLLMSLQSVSGQSLVINEFMASNETSVADPDFGAFADWIEIYNLSSSSVDLGGLFLTDDPTDPFKSPMPAALSLKAHGYAVFWADDRATGLHTNFRLSADGESIGLFDAAGNAVDLIVFGPQSTDISFGRTPDGGDQLLFFGEPTPGAPNASSGFLGLADPPTYSLPGGLYDAGLTLTLSTNLPDAAVHFTTDGSPPTESSQKYDNPIAVSVTTVLRAAVFKDGYIPSTTTTHTYVIGAAHSLPVVSLSTDPANFFDDQIGIYVEGTNGIPGYCRSIPLNWNQDWERPIQVEHFEPDGQPGFVMDAGVKIHGGCTRIYPQKSLALYARSQYGQARIEYPIFPNRPFSSYNNLVLRSSAQDWWRTMFRDGMIQTVIEHGMNVETMAYRPAVVYLNGAYWGIHNLREKQNEHFFADRAGVEPEFIEILEGNKADLGGQSEHYDEMLSFILSTDMSQPQALETVDLYMDVDEYIDYLAAEIYSANADWPGNNLKLWRPMVAGGRWRWVIFDMDFGFGGNGNGQYDDNTLALATDPNGSDWPNPPWSTFLLRTLLRNTDFRNEFIQRFAAHINTTFDPPRVLHVIDSLRAAIAGEIPRHKQRWPQSISFTPTWEDGIDIMREFATNRPLYVRPHFYAYFGLTGSSRLTLAVDDPDGGRILANGVPMPSPAFDAVFFKDVPIRLQAVPGPGYRFDGWRGASVATTDTTSVTLSANDSITALFSVGETGTDNPQETQHEDRLLRNYPNPFSSTTTADFELATPGPVTVEVFDVLGRRVATVAAGFRPAGTYSEVFDGTSLRSGIYILSLTTPSARLVRQITLVR